MVDQLAVQLLDIMKLKFFLWRAARGLPHMKIEHENFQKNYGRPCIRRPTSLKAEIDSLTPSAQMRAKTVTEGVCGP